jgi:hypothetical protein
MQDSSVSPAASIPDTRYALDQIADLAALPALSWTTGPQHTPRMTKRNFLQLDVFASAPGRGNPLAVVLDAADLDSAVMQTIAAWLNLSETTFVLPTTQPGADYRLRIFTPGQELPFAGHPSVGTAHAMIERGLVTPRDGRLVQECGAGLLPIRVDGEGRQRRLHVRAPRGAERTADPNDALTGVDPGCSVQRMSLATRPRRISPLPAARHRHRHVGFGRCSDGTVAQRVEQRPYKPSRKGSDR